MSAPSHPIAGTERGLPERVLRALDDAIAKVEASRQAKNEPIAVIGMGCRFPGGANDPAAFWELLRAGTDAIREVPPGRWDMERWHGEGPDGTDGLICTREGGFLDEVDRFDANYFGISPREACSLDPQHRLLMEVAVEALESAGRLPERLGENKTGVFIGITNNDYLTLLRTTGDPAEFDGYFVTGNTLNAAAGRLSFALGLTGPSMAIDTACSSSLVAVHLACQSLRAGECAMALAGGVNLILSPDASVALSRARMLSPDGRCKSFDADADGYGRGEGCGVVILKRLAAALKDGDPVLAIIRASAVNQDGPSAGFTVPSGPAQEALIRKALENAQLAPADISYLEAHGTGTSLGDPIELGALAGVLGEGRPADRPLLAGSVKTNIGHLESAAGIASLIKVVLSLQHAQLPPLANFKKPSPRIAWDEVPVQLVTQLTAWERSAAPRRAGISAFGVSGTNAHLIVEEAPAAEPATAGPAGQCHLLALSAKTPPALRELAARFEVFLAGQPEVSFGDVCFTAGAGRAHHSCRLSVVAGSGAEAAGMLRAFRDGAAIAGLASGASAAEPEVAWFFPGGNFGQPAVARELYETQPPFRAAFDHCAQLAQERYGLDLTGALHGASGEVAEFAFEHALAQTLISWGAHPAAVFGKGVGYCVAGCLAGVFGLEDALKLAVARAGSRAELERTAHEIAFRRPGIRFLCGASGRPASGEIATPGWWIRELQTPSAPLAPEPASLGEHGIDFTLTLGGEAIAWGTSIAAPRPQTPAARPFLELLGALHARGAAIRPCADDLPRRRVALPGYPWQRERYWLEHDPAKARALSPPEASPWLDRLRAGEETKLAEELAQAQAFTEAERTLLPKLLRALTASVRPASAFADWLYSIEWRTLPARLDGAAGRLPAPEWLASRLDGCPADEPRPAYFETMRQIEEQVAIAFIVRALAGMGWRFAEGRRFTLDEAARELRVHAKHRQLFRRLFQILAETGVVAATDAAGDAWEIRRAPDLDAAVPGPEALLAHCPEALAEITLLHSCGSNLPAVLRGERDPLQLLFAADQAVTATSLYHDSPTARRMNALVRESVSAIIERLPATCALRVLEIGAGTGATTLGLLPLFPPERTEYCFTDISPGFTALAKRKFHDFPFLRYEVLDIEKDPAAQGFEAGSYDLIIAANVLHATADLRQAVAHARALLAPGGLLILRELTVPLRFTDLIFGLTEGWWRFADHALRSSHPLLSVERWRQLLGEEGFFGAVAHPRSDDGNGAKSEAILIARAESLAPSRAVPEPARRWLLFADRGGVAARIAALLQSRGDDCAVVSKGVAFAAGATGDFTVDPGSPGDFRRLFADAAVRGVSRVLYLWGLDCEPGGDLAAEAETACRDCLHLAQALLDAALASVPPLTLVTRGAMPAGGSAQNPGFHQAGLWGIGRILTLEHPECDCALLDLDPTPSLGEAEAILAECEPARRGEPQIAFRAEGRRVPRLARFVPPLPGGPVAFDPEASYLITGGLGGLGLSVAEWMIARGARHLVLAARREPDAAAVEKLRRLTDAGARAVATRADISQAGDVARILREIESSGHALRGIVHAAGVLDDGVLRQLTWERFQRVLRPKVAGAWHLHHLTEGLPLDFFVIFSSATALLGSPGQANHVAANTFLDAFAHFRRSQGLPALSINWGPWAEIGAAARRQIGGKVGAKGIGMIPPAQGLEALAALFGQTAAAQAGVVPIDWSQVPRKIVVQPFFGAFAKAQVGARTPEDDFLAQFQAAPPASRRELVVRHAHFHVAKVLGLDPAAPADPDQSLLSLGLDSLTSVELRNHLQKSLGIPLPATLAYDHPTIAKVGAFLLSELSPPPISTPHPPSVTNGKPAPAGSDLDALSESELGALLDEELSALNPSLLSPN